MCQGGGGIYCTPAISLLCSRREFVYLGGFAIEFGITLLLLSASSPLVKLQSFDFSGKLFEREQPTVVCVCVLMNIP